jgi:hypothetical protein
MLFSEILATLPTIDHLTAIELSSEIKLIARIENKPGSAGSVRVYHALFQEFGKINRAAAKKGLEMYAEHTEDALAFPGKHPNIDRLLKIVSALSNEEASETLLVTLLPV